MKSQHLKYSIANLKESLKGQVRTEDKRHKWTPEQLNTLVKKYRQWATRAGPHSLFRLKDFIMSMRDELEFFRQLPDKNFYDRVKRTLYRSLAKKGIAWKHYGKTQIDKQKIDQSLRIVLEELEKRGVSIATDGSVLLIFPLQYYTHESHDGYFVPTIPHAISHLQKMIQALPEEQQELKETAKEVIRLLQDFLNIWRAHPQKEVLLQPNIKRELSNEYEVTETDKPGVFKVEKDDGTIYYTDVENATCTCPAGQAGKICKHITNIAYNKKPQE